ncbi:CRISPR-associated helicase Cas3' [Vulcanisaeta distributa]|uniref:CRISPR-associated helicase Cas3' n=1 Tax=Vulcanisaeta distributa TaxID=164451 RepID=UPI0006CF3821|nr:CRISPR-associated helicase Cas3' [Vulcanisaeta distributa]
MILKAPTGSGKTEILASVFLMQWRMKDWFAGRLYWVEPMHALLRQMRDRLEIYAKLVNKSLKIGEDHGEVINKTFLYTAPITLTTVDTLIYGYVARRVQTWRERGVETGRYTLPAGLIMNSLVIFDEAHLIQDEAFLGGSRVLARVICSIVKAGGLVIFATATLPKSIKKEFTELCSDDSIREITINGPMRQVTVNIVDSLLIENIDTIPCNDFSIVILNTVDRARNAYERLRERCDKNNEGKVALIHSLMTRSDREEVYRRISNAENLRNSEKGTGFILVGTQAVEVGIDFSFNRLYTESSPMDSLIQRIGRVGRRGVKGEATIFTQLESPAPYNDEIIKVTHNQINRLKTIDFSDVNAVSNLLDSVYTSDLVEKISSRGDELFHKSMDYLENLHLFAYPPDEEAYEFLIRPSYYVEVVILDVDKLIHYDSDMSVDKALAQLMNGGCVRYETRNNKVRILCSEDTVHMNMFKLSISELREGPLNKYQSLVSNLGNATSPPGIYLLTFNRDEKATDLINKAEERNMHIDFFIFENINKNDEVNYLLWNPPPLIAILSEVDNLQIYQHYTGLNTELLKPSQQATTKKKGGKGRKR